MDFFNGLLSALFPSRCLICRQTIMQFAVNARIEICRPCYQQLPLNRQCCLRCALPLPEDSSEHTLCGRCIRSEPAFDYAVALFGYQDKVVSLVHGLKFSRKITIARSLGELLLLQLNQRDLPGCLLPVPLHPNRLRQRGFNQSIEIARVISRRLAIPVEYNAVVRLRDTGAQSELPARQRKTNIKGAFAVVQALPYRHVLLVDDVITTGATVNELALQLKRNGVQRVGVLSIARTPLRV